MTALPPPSAAQAHDIILAALAGHATRCFRMASSRKLAGDANRLRRERLRTEGRQADYLLGRFDEKVSAAQVAALLGLRP